MHRRQFLTAASISFVLGTGAPSRPPSPDEVVPFEEGATLENCSADLLALIYAEVNRRGGIV